MPHPTVTSRPAAPRAALAALALLLLAARPLAAAEPGAQQLIVFVQPHASAVARHFTTQTLPQLRQIAAQQQVDLIVRDLSAGAPAEVQITPLIVFQNHRGRSIYQGRTHTLDRVAAFIRTARYVPQGDGTIASTDIAVWRQGRSTTWSPIKIAAVTGTPPPDYDHAAFETEARAAIAAGFTHYSVAQTVSLDRADRGFYMDFYPWRADDGTLFLSMALYSQFHCKHSVWEYKTDPLTGPYTDRLRLYRQAAALMEKAVATVIADPDSGDAFDPVPASVQTVTWDALGLALPPPPAAGAATDLAITLPRAWTIAPPRDDAPPMVAFRFAPPHDSTAGYAKTTRGTFTFADDSLTLEGATASFSVDMRTITMGDQDLDQALQSRDFFHTSQHPASTFTLKRLERTSDTKALAFGDMATVLFHGDFTFKGQTLPLTAPMQLEVVLTDTQKPELWLRGTFSLNIQPFGLDPGFQTGPPESRFTVIYDLNLRMHPAPQP